MEIFIFYETGKKPRNKKRVVFTLGEVPVLVCSPEDHIQWWCFIWPPPPPLLVSTVILVKHKECTRYMMAICGTRLKQLTSRTISTWISYKLVAWAICNVVMMLAISIVLTNVETKQFGMATLFTNFKEIILHMVCLSAKLIISPPFIWSCVQLAYITLCTCRQFNSSNNSFGYAWSFNARRLFKKKSVWAS
jgi:hypothetical protein